MANNEALGERLIKKITLDNGLILELHDRSKRVAGDRWLVSFVACIDVAVKPEYLEGQDLQGPSSETIRKELGEKVAYRYEKSRHFIAETEKDEILKGLIERFLNATLAYLSSAKFPRNAILSKYKQRGTGRTWKAD